MVRPASLFPIAAILAATPASAQEREAPVNIPATRLERAVNILGLQSGASIGVRDPSIRKIRVRAVKGSMTAGAALILMLRDTGARARRIAPSTFVIEPAPPPRQERLASPVPAPEPVPAYEPPPVEIVVTGTKREIPLGAYPGMVHIVEGDHLTYADGAKGTGAIEARVASVVSTHLGPGRNKLFIRGIADSSFVGPTQATVGQYWGNSRITYSAPDPSLKLYDVGRIEVLEGPQGTLYGAGSLGGVVRVMPREPDLGRTGGAAWMGVEAVQHGKPGTDGGAVLNLPVVEDRLGFRAVAFGSLERGYIDDVTRERDDVNDVRTIGGRASLRYAGDDGWSVHLSAVGQRIDGDDGQYAERRGGDGLERASAIAQPYRNDFVLTDLVIRKRWDALEFTSSLGYAYQDVVETFEGPVLSDPGDAAVGPADNASLAAFRQSNRIHMMNAEARLAKTGPQGTGWLIAASLLRNRATVNRRMDVFTLDSPLTGVRNKVEEVTIYGEATIQPLARLTTTLGGRLAHSRLSGDSQNAIEAVAFSLDPTARATRTETRLLPSASIAYRPSDRLTMFARYQEGFRPGGIAVRREFIQRYQGDRVGTFEAGARYHGARVQIEASGSWTDWRNIQADVIDGFGFPTTTNIGNGRVWSIGLATRWRPVAGLQIDAAAYFNDSEVTQRSQAVLALLPEARPASASRLPNIADVTGRLGFDYAHPLGAEHDLRLSGFGRYVGKSILGIGPVLGKLQGDYFDTGMDASIGRGGKRVSLSVTNLFDAKGNRFALGSPFLVRDRDQITPLKPRTVRLGFELSF